MRLLALITAFCALAACGAGDYDDASYEAEAPPAPLSARTQVSVDRSFINQLGRPTATVTARNNSDQYLHIDVQCTFFDANGRVVATGTDLIQNVPPGGAGRGDTRSYEGAGAFERVECRVERAVPAA